MSALPLKADTLTGGIEVRFVMPIAERRPVSPLAAIEGFSDRQLGGIAFPRFSMPKLGTRFRMSCFKLSKPLQAREMRRRLRS